MRRQHRRKRDTLDRLLDDVMEGMVRDGVLEWTGLYQDGLKQYRMTDAARYAYDKLRPQFTEDEIKNGLPPPSMIEAIFEYTKERSRRQEP